MPDGARTLVTAVASAIVGAGGATLVIREWQWLRFCRYVHDAAEARGQDPDPENVIKAAAEGRVRATRAAAPTKQRGGRTVPVSTRLVTSNRALKD